jgi:YVTN family beta-propeller protein
MKKLSVFNFYCEFFNCFQRQMPFQRKICVLLILSSALSFSACKKEKDDPAGKYSNGVFVTNEGPFGSGTGTVSFIDRDKKTIENDIFEKTNNRPLGNIVQSLTIIGNKAYIVVNNADKIEIAHADDFTEAGVISGLKLPRYMVAASVSKAYVSQWGNRGVNGEVKVINLVTNAVTKTIATGKGAEGMLLVGNKLFVANAGGFDNDSTVVVIDTNTDSVVATITVGSNPASMAKDMNGNVWVLCMGKWKADFSSLEVKGSLYKLNASNYQVLASFQFDSEFSQPTDLIVNKNGNKLYYSYNGKVYTQDINAASLQLNVLIPRNFYALGIDPVSEYLYAGDAGNFQSNGKVLRYNSVSGAVIDSFEAGIGPNGFYFK